MKTDCTAPPDAVKLLLLIGFAMNIAVIGCFLLWSPSHAPGAAAAIPSLGIVSYLYLQIGLNYRRTRAKGDRVTRSSWTGPVTLPSWLGRMVLFLALTSAKRVGLDRNQEWPCGDSAPQYWLVIALIAISYGVYVLTIVYIVASGKGAERIAVAPIGIAAILTAGLLVACCKELVAWRVKASESGQTEHAKT